MATHNLNKSLDERAGNTGNSRTSNCRDMPLLPTKEAHSAASGNAASAQKLAQALAPFPDLRASSDWHLDPGKEPHGQLGIWQVRQADDGSANANLFASEVIKDFEFKRSEAPDAVEAQDQEHGGAGAPLDLASARHQIELLETRLEAALRMEENAVAAAALLTDELPVLRRYLDELTSAAAVNGEENKIAVLSADLNLAHEEIATLRASAAAVQLEAKRASDTGQAAAAQRMRELDSERERSASLSHELASLREQVREMKSEAAAETTAQEQTIQAAVATASERQQLLDEELAKVAVLSADLAAAREEIGATRANAASAQLEAARVLDAAQATAAQRGRQLDHERERAAAVAKELASLNERLEEMRSRAAAATAIQDQTTHAAQDAVTAVAELKQTLNEERAKVAALSADLTGARKEIAAREAGAAAAQLAAARALEAAQTSVAQKREELEYERGRVADLVSQLAAAREEVEAFRASLAATAERVRIHEQYAEPEGDWRRSSGLALAAPSDLVERSVSNDPRHPLGRQPDGSAGPKNGDTSAAERSGELSRSRQELDALRERITALEAQAGRPAEAVGRAPNHPEPNASAPSLPALQSTDNVARAGALVQQGDIKGAQLVLEREVAAGSARAAFALAETYDPRMLSSWRTFGVRSNPSKAREFYQRAYDGGIQEARRRADALR